MSIEQTADLELSKHSDGWTKNFASVAGMRAIKMVGSPQGEPDSKVVVYYIETQYGPYLLQFMAPAKAWQLYYPLFAKIASSLQVS
jgi:hypothetical protein